MRDLKPLTRDDTEHGVEYVKLADVIAERESDRAVMREALEVLAYFRYVDHRQFTVSEYIKADAAISKLRARVG